MFPYPPFPSMRKNRRARNAEKPPQVRTLPTIQNVVSFAELKVEDDFELWHLAEKIENARLNKRRFPAVIMRRTDPKCTILVFSSARIIIIGSSSEAQAELAAREARRLFVKALNIPAKLTSFRITNIVANADFGFKINITTLCEQRGVIKNENFPGVIFKGLKDVKSALIFSSGKVVFTGAKAIDDIDAAFLYLEPLLRQHEIIHRDE
jgi:transcription initiation factor TFIID TATA-box-binding protein